jgi:hypothetical protein
MKVTKWVDMGADVDVEIDVNDISAALSEAFEHASDGPLDERPTQNDITRAFNNIAQFFNGFTDAHLSLLNEKQKQVIGKYLDQQVRRFLR